MTKYRIDYEYKQFGDITVDATDDEHAEDLALEHILDLHSLAPEDIEIVNVVDLEDSHTIHG